ncbi:MAG: hypothetical protein RR598_10240 [Anaerorhabdus sp.]|uniref:hypothetical protein n=1 Tax=Anaerorhabdus sp. TaxID=1872524 RepID=UPI002FC5C7FA
MTRYIKKPIPIEAFQYDGDLVNRFGKPYVPQWFMKEFNKKNAYYGSLSKNEPPCELFIKTLEVSMHVSVGDYIIKGVCGEIYPCKKEIFEESYDKVEI